MSDDGVSEDGVGMPIDAAAEARVRAALAGAGSMPAEVWDRLEQVLSDEAATRVPSAAAAGAAPPAAEVVPLAARRRRTPLLAGLAAAAAAVIAVAVITPQLTGGGSGDIVATAEVPAASPALLSAEGAAPPDSGAAANAPADEGPAAAAPKAEAAPPAAPEVEPAPDTAASPRSRAEEMLAVRQVTSTGTDYTPDSMDDAVMKLVDTVGASRTRLMSSVTQEPDPTEGDSGFTATVEGLATCVRSLTQAADRQALVIDRATYQGVDVGIVVVPVGIAAIDHAMPFTQIDIWVVPPDCGASTDAVLWHGTLSMP